MISYFGIQYNFFWETEEVFMIMKRVDVKKNIFVLIITCLVS